MNMLMEWPVDFWARAAAAFYRRHQFLPSPGLKAAREIMADWWEHRIDKPTASPLVGVEAEIDWRYAFRLMNAAAKECFQ